MREGFLCGPDGVTRERTDRIQNEWSPIARS